MAFILFILAVCIVVLFVNMMNLKNDNSFIKTVLKRHTDENDSLKAEIEILKKSIAGRPIQTESITPPPAEIKPWEIIIEEEKPYFTPIPDEDLPKSEETPTPVSPIFGEPIKDIISDHSAYFPATPDEELPKEAAIEAPEEVVPITIETFSPVEEPILSYESQTLPRYEKPSEERVYEESAFSAFMKKAEKQFADNWTGILGTAIMVLGIGYLSIYTALKVSPLYRVLILWAYAGLLIGSYYLLKKKEKWEKTGLWLRSAGASLFLFGCFGASQIPALAFIDNQIAGYSLIGLGIALNLFVGYIIRQQTFLSLHVILSMLILCVIPDKTLATFLLAATTSAIGIILSYKEKWEYHLLVVIIAFIIFDIWFNAQGTALTTTENILAIAGIVVVAASCMFMQYRSVYENTHFDKAGFITHLTNWVLFATGLILHSTGSRFKTFVLFGGAITCFFMALKARNKKVYWLYHLDGMVAFVLCSLSVIMLNDWNIGIDIIACILYLITVVCLFVVYKEKEELLHRIFLGINHVLVVLLLLFSALLNSQTIEKTQVSNTILSISMLAAIGLAVTIFSNIKKDYLNADAFFGDKKLSLNGLFSIGASLLLFFNCYNLLEGNYFYYVMIGTALLWCVLRAKLKSNTFDLGRLVFLAASILIGIVLIKIEEQSYLDLVFALGITAVISFNWFVKRLYKDEFLIRFIGILGMNALFVMGSYKYLLDHTTGYILTLLGFALLNHEFLWFHFKRKSLTTDNQIVLYVGYYFFAIGSGIALLFNTYYLTNTEIGLSCLGIAAVAAYALFAKRFRNKSDEVIAGWGIFNLLNSELIIFSVLVFGFSCFAEQYTQIYLAAIAVIAFFGFQKAEEFRRYNFYSFLLLVLSIAMTLFIALDKFDLINKTTLYITQAVTILLSVAYAYLQSKSEDEKVKNFSLALPYIQNSWIIALLFIQVQLSYLPLLFMGLGLLNFWLITTERIKIKFHFAPLIGLLAIIVSVFYSFNKLNDFDAIDWILQLASVVLGLVLVILIDKKETIDSLKPNYQLILNAWLSLIMFSQLPHKWLPVYWAAIAIVNLYLYHKKISQEKNISIVYYFLANVHLGFLSFMFYESKFLAVYLLIFSLLAVYIYLAYKWLEEYTLKNSLLIYPATLSIGCFLYLTFDKGILTFFWILEALGLLILGILLKEKYFRYVSLSLVGLCVIRLMFFDLSNADFLIRALVLLGVGVVLIIMNSLFKKYKDRFD